ncbi:long-chain fatty acid--CoA ligase [Prosthecomicrobium hirschii]|uniref:AMP-dependent synthetase/ligase n=1 Tax=Prosthecodimorpha hirschii TaxID=665126 RepID=UPI00112776E7|nr:AMP-binding protein [Prosthecomicrobium hirschii]TPQ52219.1 long-chain fatty acid--CoA ligase [Prosthecomicrobium hirschii]
MTASVVQTGLTAAADLPQTLIAALVRNATVYRDRIAFRERRYGIWQEQTWTEVLDEVLAIAAGLESLGLSAGSAMTVIGDNRPRLYYAMLAANMLRAFPSPAFPDIPLEELIAATRHGNAMIAIGEDQEQVDKLLELRAATGRAATILYDDERGFDTYAVEGLMSIEALVGRGRERLAREPGLRDRLIGAARADDVTVLLHSSGTTGLPKGIPLLHRNVTQGVANAARSGYFHPHEELYAYLPTAWVGDFVFTLGAGLMMAATINVPERQETVLRDLREVSPTFYLAAPRAWDQMLTRVQVGMKNSTPFKRWLFDAIMPRAIELERKRLAGGTATLSERVVDAIGNLLVYAPLRDYLGLARAERAFTGGEALGEDTFLFFRALGIKLKQFYGQTETCALTAAQTEGHVKLHTVGRPIEGAEIRIDDSGEILVRSPSVIAGYFDDSEATAKAIVDGWLHTGDAGRIDEDGDLIVLGRVSEVVRTAAGERYIPNFIENRLKFSPYIRNVAVIGAGRDLLTAIVCIDFDAVGHWAEERALSYTSYAELSQRPEVQGLVAEVVRHVNKTQPEALRVRRFVNLHKDFDADDGEITRTRKLRRNMIETTYAPLIDALYGGAVETVYEAAITYENGERGVIRRTLRIGEV